MQAALLHGKRHDEGADKHPHGVVEVGHGHAFGRADTQDGEQGQGQHGGDANWNRGRHPEVTHDERDGCATGDFWVMRVEGKVADEEEHEAGSDQAPSGRGGGGAHTLQQVPQRAPTQRHSYYCICDVRARLFLDRCCLVLLLLLLLLPPPPAGLLFVFCLWLV